MGAFIAKQPNGLYCRFSYVVDCPTHWNMTEEDYINMCIERAKIDAEIEARNVLKNYIRPFSLIHDSFNTNNMTQEEFDKFLKDTSEPVYKKVVDIDNPTKEECKMVWDYMKHNDKECKHMADNGFHWSQCTDKSKRDIIMQYNGIIEKQEAT